MQSITEKGKYFETATSIGSKNRSKELLSLDITSISVRRIDDFTQNLFIWKKEEIDELLMQLQHAKKPWFERYTLEKGKYFDVRTSIVTKFNIYKKMFNDFICVTIVNRDPTQGLSIWDKDDIDELITQLQNARRLAFELNIAFEFEHLQDLLPKNNS